MSPTQMTLSDPSHAAEQRKNLPSLAPDSVVSTILRIQTRLAIKARDDNRKMGGVSPWEESSLLSLSFTPPEPLLPCMLSSQLWLISNASEEGKN